MFGQLPWSARKSTTSSGVPGDGDSGLDEHSPKPPRSAAAARVLRGTPDSGPRVTRRPFRRRCPGRAGSGAGLMFGRYIGLLKCSDTVRALGSFVRTGLGRLGRAQA